MSSIQRSTAAPTSEPSTAKKKFGKNLNKLTKPPAPPISNAGSSRQNSSSRNGLLLLSTKRSSSGGTTSLSSGGLLSGKSTANRTADSTGTSAHDALLSAAVGASRGGDVAQNASVQQPDAWGTAEKQQAAGTSDTSQPALAPKGGVSSGYHQNTNASYEEPKSRPSDNVSPAPRYERRSRYNDGEHASEYSRQGTSNEQQRSETGEDEQLAYMSRLARDRSERRRAEEEARTREQKERASQRLKELEGKMKGSSNDKNESRAMHSPAGVPLSIMARSPVADVATSQTPKSPVVLERLGRTKSGKESDGLVGSRVSSTSSNPDRGTTRTLFDPNRTYSSLVGGNASQKDDRRGGNDEKSSQPDAATAPNNTRQYGRSRDGSFDNTNEDTAAYPMIHLSSYEDRDRGERNSSAGPRMLFDPKSGSMVAVKSREDTSTGGRAGRRDRGKPKGRNARDRDVKDRETSSPTERNDSKQHANNDVALIKPSRKPKGRKEDRKRGDFTDISSPLVEVKNFRNRGKGSKQPNRLPRTCGVLYTRDDKGNCVCADGCDADQGYGSHGVPGGRVRNPDAYAKFLEQHQHFPTQEAGLFGAGRYGASYPVQQYHDRDAGVDPSAATGGFDPSPLDDTPLAQQKVDWVKPNEKIELVTGIDDSPTLQATANPWAPSEAALAAAAAAAKDSAKKNPPADVTIDTNEDVENEDDPPSFIGLGFDPTENMDSVMRSPTNLHSSLTKKFDAVDLAALSLDGEGDSASRNIFAFGSPTWGTSGSGRLSSWTVLGAGEEEATKDKASGGTSSFLSLSSLSVNQEGNTWGTAGLTGLGGTALPSAHASDGGAAD